ncbi:MAG: Na+/H+ antiporter NhaC family protein [Butyricicoccus pullicaecorum]|nr:Na+/H+ antiporter NhaC family protein [Butyricicoccus pullicaecorum]
MSATIFAVLPPIIAIALALITKEVYSSLLIGIFAGALMFCGFNPLHATETTFSIMGSKISDNIGILIFLVMLGILVSLVTKSGASRAYGEWASRVIKSRRGALLATSFLGMFIFVDDYFNCLTVGTVMRPVTDKYRITRAKLAYIIDSTAAPVCIIAPISSWAAAVTSSLPPDAGINGFTLFLNTIPFNLYALLTLAFVLWVMIADIDFMAMGRYNKRVLKSGKIDSTGEESTVICGAGSVKDLIIPILFLIAACIAAMIYSGGGIHELSFEAISTAFANCSSSDALVLGSFATLVFTFFMYVPRGILTFNQFCESFTAGFKAMVPAIFILTLAWTLSGICSDDYLNLRGFVAGFVNPESAIGLLMPAIFFLIALGLAFATGTSWGTFAILIPIAVTIFGASEMLTITVSACLAGAVCGDHISPISDTTILASAGAQCHHIDHVSTQIPYALSLAVISLAGYLAAGFTQNGWVGLGVGAVLLIVFMIAMTHNAKKQEQEEN